MPASQRPLLPQATRLVNAWGCLLHRATGVRLLQHESSADRSRPCRIRMTWSRA